MDELDELFAASRRGLVWILKHSIACGVSGAALDELRAFARERPPDEVFAVVIVQHARRLSDAVSERTGIPHRSPQLLLLRDGEVAWQASYWAIEERALRLAAHRLGGAGAEAAAGPVTAA
jgi:bacillithiol system protein YtxJ